MPANHESNYRPIVIVGAGLAGLACSLMLQARGHLVTLVGPPGEASDTRTTALLDGSVQALQNVGVDITAHAAAAPLRVMSIVDATRRLIRARPIAFEAREIGLEAFGWNISNGALVQALWEKVRAQGIEHVPGRLIAAQAGERGINLAIENHEALISDLVVAADGRNSMLRGIAGIQITRHDYPQVALAVNLAISRDHRDISTEFHTESGAFTLVPLPGRRASLVWMVSPSEADRLRSLSDAALSLEIERQSHALLGSVRIDSARSFWPMASIIANSYGHARIALIGEAAHVLPPIGAQGFNLTLRDIAALGDALAGAADPGVADVLEKYGRARRLDVGSRHSVVSLLNKSLLSDHFHFQGLRGLGLYALERVGPLRRIVMRQGLAKAAKD